MQAAVVWTVWGAAALSLFLVSASLAFGEDDRAAGSLRACFALAAPGACLSSALGRAGVRPLLLLLFLGLGTLLVLIGSRVWSFPASMGPRSSSGSERSGGFLRLVRAMASLPLLLLSWEVFRYAGTGVDAPAVFLERFWGHMSAVGSVLSAFMVYPAHRVVERLGGGGIPAPWSWMSYLLLLAAAGGLTAAWRSGGEGEPGACVGATRWGGGWSDAACAAATVCLTAFVFLSADSLPAAVLWTAAGLTAVGGLSVCELDDGTAERRALLYAVFLAAGFLSLCLFFSVAGAVRMMAGAAMAACAASCFFCVSRSRAASLFRLLTGVGDLGAETVFWWWSFILVCCLFLCMPLVRVGASMMEEWMLWLWFVIFLEVLLLADSLYWWESLVLDADVEEAEETGTRAPDVDEGDEEG